MRKQEFGSYHRNGPYRCQTPAFLPTRTLPAIQLLGALKQQDC